MSLNKVIPFDMTEKTTAEILLQKYIDGRATDQERVLLEAWYQQHELKNLPEVSELKKTQQLQRIRTKLVAHTATANPVVKTLRLWPRVAIAASILFAIATGVYLVLYKPVNKQEIAKQTTHDLAPGGNKAILTLAGGKQIAVGGSKASLLTYQGKTKINIGADDALTYHAEKADKTAAISYNTLTTPRGGQYPLVLADGTKVWLDAASSITFPVAFTGNSREVSISGQVYFEVAHNAAKPFRVTAGHETVEVLGTHFNINAYGDEPAIKTTLFEGSIKIASGNNKAVLKPGQQAQAATGKMIVTNDADMDEAIAWHKGIFEFHDASIQTVMRQLSRWYDVEISYEGPVTERHFSGKIYRNISALKVSDILSYKEIHFRIEGKKIIVMP